METWPEAPPLQGDQVHAGTGVNLGGTAEGLCLSSQSGTRGFLFVSELHFQYKEHDYESTIGSDPQRCAGSH